MQLLTLFSVTAALVAVVHTIPTPEPDDIVTRNTNSTGIQSEVLQVLANKNGGSGKKSTSTASSKSTVADVKSTSKSVAAVAATNTATSTVDVNPDFDLVAATSAEKAAAVSVSILSTLGNIPEFDFFLNRLPLLHLLHQQMNSKWLN
jgi:hypothetical protein